MPQPLTRPIPSIAQLTYISPDEDKNNWDFHVVKLLRNQVLSAYTPYDGVRGEYVKPNERVFLAITPLLDIYAARVQLREETKIRLRVSPHLDEVIELIAKEFTRPDGHHNYRMPSTHFDPIIEAYSKPLVNKAKKALGIRSRHAGKDESYNIGEKGRLRWDWEMPVRTIEQAKARIVGARYDISDERRLNDPRAAQCATLEDLNRIRAKFVSKALIDVMVKHNFVCSATTGNWEMNFSVSYRTWAKTGLGVVPWRHSTGRFEPAWIWLWPGPPVCQWVLDGINGGADMDTIYAGAKEKGWPDKLIQLAARALIDTRRMTASWRPLTFESQ